MSAAETRECVTAGEAAKAALVVLIGLGTAAMAGSAQAQATRTVDRFQVSTWSGSALYRGNQFRSCSIRSSYRNGITLTFIQLANNRVLLGMSNRSWTLQPSNNYHLNVGIDRTKFGRVRGRVTDSNRSLVLFTLGTNERLFQALRAGQILYLSQDQANYSFRLTGTSAALARMRTCVDTHTGRIETRPETISEAPFGRTDPDELLDGARFGAGAMQALAGRMRANGYTTVAAAERQRTWPGTYQVWRGQSEILGALISLKDASGDADRRYRAYLQRLDRSCRGRFSSDVFSRHDWGQQTVIRAIAACEESGQNYVLPFTLISHGEGAVVAIHFGKIEAQEQLFQADDQLVEALRARYGS